MHCDEYLLVILNNKGLTWLKRSAILTEYSYANQAILFFVSFVSDYS